MPSRVKTPLKTLDPQLRERHLRRSATGHKVLAVFALVALAVQSGILFLALFEPPLAYHISEPARIPIDSEQFLMTMASLTGGGVYRRNRIDVLTNGESFYDAELKAIARARRYINIECYIFQKGEVTRRFLDALAERARAGVQVRLLIDAIGSVSTSNDDLRPLQDAGGRVGWYHPVRWYTWPRINNRTHREMVVVDGEVGFAGGAGFADHWYVSRKDHPRWRDMMVRIEGDAVTGLDGVFAENWLESMGEVLLNPVYFPLRAGPGEAVTLVVGSAPTTGRSTYARVLFQSMVASARRQVHISSPYFLPDRSLAAELVRARERGVEVKIVVPGVKSDHELTRTSSRRLYGDLLRAGGRIYEYQPAMNHTKSMLIDGLWAVVGSTNVDSRSFGLNDELNVAVRDPAVAARIERDFQADIASSREVSYQQWRNRSAIERVKEYLGALVQRQQ